EGGRRHQSLRELVELSEPNQLAFAVGLVSFGLGRRSLVEKREAQLDGADENAIPVEDLPTALLLPVDGQLTLGVHLREVEVLAVENDLRVVVGDAVRPDGDVVPASAADRRDLLVDREDLRAPLRLDP